MCLFMSFLYVTNLVTIISLFQELHYIGILSLSLQKEKKKREEKTLLWLLLLLNFSSGSQSWEERNLVLQWTWYLKTFLS